MIKETFPVSFNTEMVFKPTLLHHYIFEIPI